MNRWNYKLQAIENKTEYSAKTEHKTKYEYSLITASLAQVEYSQISPSNHFP